MSFELIAVIILAIWLGAMTIAYWQLKSHYDALIAGNDKKTLTGTLEQILKQNGNHEKDIAFLREQYAKMEQDSLRHIQKIGLLRFNPFKDTGGDQSFIVALVDAQHTGIVISGLYSRSGTRWYAKQVVEGKGLEHELSTEEKKAIEAAKYIA